MDDLYTQWLGVPAGARPPDHYALLRLPRFCSDLEKIEAAAQRQLDALDRYAIHPELPKRDACHQMMSEVARARIVLTHPQKRQEYDQVLSPGRRPMPAPAPRPAPAPMPMAEDAAVSHPAPVTVEPWIVRFLKTKRSPDFWVAPIMGGLSVIGALVIGVYFWSRPTPPQQVAVNKPAANTTPVTKVSAPTLAPTPETPTAVAVAPNPVQPAPASSSKGLFDTGHQTRPQPAPTAPPAIVPPPIVPAPSPPAPAPPVALVKPPDVAPASDGLKPIPNAAAQAHAAKLIDDIFARDIARATSAQEKSTIAAKMLQLAGTLDDDPAGRYLLQMRTSDVAISAGDIQIAIDAISSCSKEYRIDALQLKAAAVTGVAKKLTPDQPHRPVADMADAVIADAIAHERYDLAIATASAAAQAAQSLHDTIWTAQADHELAQAQAAQSESTRIQPALATLTAHPDDPQANEVVGRYRCLEKNDWAGGLPMLAKGATSPTRALARKELAVPVDPEQIMDLANGWWDYGQSLQNSLERAAVLKHSGTLYRRIADGLSGLRKLQAKKRLEDLDHLDSGKPT
jgi:hypothetical protein